MLVENNALSAKDEQQRQDAKWSLPYLKDEKQKQQAEKLVSDLNTKSKAFDAALDSACKNLSSAECRGMRQELASMAKSYDEKLYGQYIGNMGTVYKDGKAEVNELMWQYATADVKAERETNVNRIAENWGVSKETAANLYDGMAAVHTTAAIGGAVYGMKGIKEPANSPKVTASIVESEKAALDRISHNGKGSVDLNAKDPNSVYYQQLIKNAEKISTAKPGQVTAPRDLNEQVLWNLVKENPSTGIKFSDKGLNLNTDTRFPKSAGFEKMTATHRLPGGTNIEIHYQYNSISGKAYDMKIVTPQRLTSDPSDIIHSIKRNPR